MTRRFIPLLILLVLVSSIYAAHAIGLGGLGVRFGKAGAIGKGKSTPLPTGKILLADGVSFLLKVDGVSKLCRAGGC